MKYLLSLILSLSPCWAALPLEDPANVAAVKTALGINNVTNTSDANKPVSTAQQSALDLKEAFLAAGTTSQYYRGDKSWQTLNKSAVGLSNVDNTADTAKPVSTAQQTALNLKSSLASPAFTGTPTVPTASVGTNTTQAASTAFVLANPVTISLSGCDFVVEGDSKSTDTSPTAGTGNTWTAQFMGLGVASGATLYNYAANGRTLSGIVSQYSAEAYLRRPAATGRVDYLSLRTGNNDEADDMSSFWTALQSHWATLRADGHKIIAWTLTLRNGQTVARQAEIYRINNLIRAASNQWDYLIDGENSKTGPPASGTAFYWADGIHENAAGNRIDAYLMQSTLMRQPVQFLQTGDMAKQNSGAVNITGGAATFTSAVNMSGGSGYPLSLTGTSAANIDLVAGGLHHFRMCMDGGGGSYGFFHSYNAGAWTNPLSFGLNSMNATFGGRIVAGGVVRLKSYTVATLPSGTAGDTAYVTDSTAPTYNGALTGGGSVGVPVFYNGSAWVSH